MPIYFELTSRELPLAIDSIGNRWNQESVRRPKGFPHYHWLQTEQGAGEVVIDGKKLNVPAGTGVLIAPFVPHFYYPSGEVWETAFVTFAGKLEADIDKIVGHERYILVRDDGGFSFRNWIEDVIAGHERRMNEPAGLSTGCYDFLMNIGSRKDALSSYGQPLYQRYVMPIVKEIETNYHQDIQIRTLADTVYISPQYLSRLFKRFVGCSASAYLTNYRMIKAKELLASRPDLAVQQISFRVGYHDTSHFIAMFKNTTGYTPLEFRRLHH